MKILIFNWRDIKNPSSGGAEILTHEIAKRWVKQGHSVTQFSSEFPGCSSEELIDRIHIIRKGHPDARYFLRSVHFQAFFQYFKRFRGRFDVVIDEIHGLPFFTPCYVKEKKVALICEVADELWQKLYGPFLGIVGRMIEIIYLRLTYRNIPYLTISESSKRDLMRNGVEEKMITVLPMGITLEDRMVKSSKRKTPTLLYVGRLSKSKGIEDAIFALESLKRTIQNIKFFIVGRGDKGYTRYLQKLVGESGLDKNVEFLGFVSEQDKFRLMAESHILLAPSAKEGFGLTVPEAGSVGTTAIVYNSPGLSEIVRNRKTGIVCVENNPQELAKAIRLVLKDKELYEKISSGAKRESKRYSWDTTAKVALSILQSTI